MYFARMREEGPVTPVMMPEGNRAWLVTRYADVRAALADPRLYKDWVGKLTPPDFAPDAVTGYLNMHLLSLTRQTTRRLRKLVVEGVHRAAGRRAAAADRGDHRVAARRDETAASQAGEETVDLIEAFAFPLPVTVICELLGVPAGTRTSSAPGRTRSWRPRRRGGVPRRGHRDVPLLHRAGRGQAALPADDLMSALIAARDSGDSLDERELIAMLFLLLVAGHETTTNLIATGMLALLSYPAELTRLRADPSLLPGAVEELLRYVNPLNHATERFTLEPVEIGGVTIPAGEWVLCVTSSATGTRPVRRRPTGSTWPGRGRAPGVRPRDPLLPRRAAGPAGGRGRVRRAAVPVPVAVACRRPASCAGGAARIHGLETLPVRLA